VLHLRERAIHPRLPAIESPIDAQACGRGVRQRVIRSTELPVLVAPATPINKVYRPYALESSVSRR